MDNGYSYDTSRCLEWLKKTHDLSVLSIEQIIGLVISWDRPFAMELFKANQEREKKKKEEEASRIDYKEEIDDSGRTWYIRAHYSHQREESRKLKQGDVIQYKNSSDGRYGVLIVKSFDYESDFVARSFFGIEVKEDENCTEPYITYAGSLCPGFDAFTIATEEEIENFFNQIKENAYSEFLFHFKCSITPDYIKEKFGKYIDDGPITWENKTDYGFDKFGNKIIEE